MAKTATIVLNVAGRNTAAIYDMGTAAASLVKTITQTLADGTGSDQIDEMWQDSRTLAISGSDSLDFAGGLTDGLGNTITMTAVKVILIYNKSSAQTLTIGAGTNPLINWIGDSSDVVKLPPGGVFLLSAPKAGYAITGGTGDTLKIANGAGATCDYDIVLLGVSV
jgi:hypothetical protein